MTQEKLKLLDLFSGIGGFSLGLERTGGFETVAFCEYDKKAQQVLKKHWPEVPIYKDVRTLDYDGTVDIITGGYPCQPFSFAGKRKGEEDDRHLWPSMFKLIQKHRPAWVIGENVAGHINMGLDSVLADLESEGYGARAFVIPAVALNAKHRRDRVWIVGHAQHDGSSSCGNIGELQGEPEWTQTTIFEFEGTSDSETNEIMANTRHIIGRDSERGSVGEDGERRLQEEVGSSGTATPTGSSAAQGIVGYANSERCEKLNISQKPKKPIKSNWGFNETVADTDSKRCKWRTKTRNDGKNRQKSYDKFSRGCCATYGLSEKSKNQWSVEPDVGRMANGIPRRMDRLKQLGNAVVPQIPEILGNAILEVENYNTINPQLKKEQ